MIGRLIQQQQQRQKVNAATKQGKALTEYMRKIGLIHDASEHGDPEKVKNLKLYGFFTENILTKFGKIFLYFQV